MDTASEVPGSVEQLEVDSLPAGTKTDGGMTHVTLDLYYGDCVFFKFSQRMLIRILDFLQQLVTLGSLNRN